ncbi:MAG: response regulator [Saprospiraceae bacterium]|nr:response regulator [Saprospiraceae bacterium]
MSEAKPIRILYVDDEMNNLVSMKATFRHDFKIYTAISGMEGLEFLKKEQVDIIITDQRMPEMTGVEFLEQVIKLYPDPVRILLTGYTDLQAVIDAVNKGKIYYYLNKPWDPQQLKTTIQNGYEIYQLREENLNLIKELERVNEQLGFLLRQKLLS